MCSSIPDVHLPYVEGHPRGANVSMPQMLPQDNGTLVYLSAGDDSRIALRVVPGCGRSGGDAEDRDLGNGIGHIALFNNTIARAIASKVFAALICVVQGRR